MLTRRQLIKRGAAGAGGLMLGNVLLQGSARAVPATAKLAPYLTDFAAPPVVTIPSSGVPGQTITAREVRKQLHPALSTAGGRYWTYAIDDLTYPGYLGPIIQVRRGTPLAVNYVYGLPESDYPARIPVDLNLTDGNPKVGLVIHLHGGFVLAADDGNPVAGVNGVPASAIYSDSGQPQAVTYPNDQRATLLWYHDHYLGATRLNVFAGLAGGYLIRDVYDTGGPGGPFDDGTPGSGENAKNPWLPVGKYELPLVIQDRQFNPDMSGDFLYPTMPPGVGTVGECGDPATSQYGTGTGPWIGEYFGDQMLVNGIPTPKLVVEPAVYRFRILNGCNARFLNLVFQNVGPGIAPPPIFTQIGAEQGLFNNPVALKQLPMVTAERADVIVDFRKFAGQDLLLRNAPLPKPYASPAPRLQDIMKIQVRGTAVAGTVPTTIDGDERDRLTGPNPIRRISLDEWNAGLPGWHLTLSPIDIQQEATYVPLPATTPMTAATAACFHDLDADLQPKVLTPEIVNAGDIEDWEFHNYTADTHPMHMHLTKFQVVDRRPVGTRPGAAGTVPPQPFEQGWKDTVAAHPGMITRIRQKFDLPNTAPAGTTQQYVYHCHIVEHEDNDMMRPLRVVKP
jgi:spore coat protein A, manganese oxidase